MDPLERAVRYIKGGRPREGAFALWLARERLQRHYASGKKDWTADRLLAQIKKQRGWAPGHSTYAALESGARKPTAEQYLLLTEFFGSAPEEEQPATPTGLSNDLMIAMTRAVERQTELLEQVLAALQGPAIQSLADRLLPALAAVEVGLSETDMEAEPDPPAAVGEPSLRAIP